MRDEQIEYPGGKTDKGAGQLDSAGGAIKIKSKTKNKPKNETKNKQIKRKTKQKRNGNRDKKKQ